MEIIQKNPQQQKLVSMYLTDINSTIWSFDHIENKHTLYRGKDYMKKICSTRKI